MERRLKHQHQTIGIPCDRIDFSPELQIPGHFHPMSAHLGQETRIDARRIIPNTRYPRAKRSSAR